MESALEIPPPERRHRHRRHRKRTLTERFLKLIEMPRLKRAERNQRLAIGAVLLLTVVYFVILRPIVNVFFPDKPTKREAPRQVGPGTRPSGGSPVRR